MVLNKIFEPSTHFRLGKEIHPMRVIQGQKMQECSDNLLQTQAHILKNVEAKISIFLTGLVEE